MFLHYNKFADEMAGTLAPLPNAQPQSFCTYSLLPIVCVFLGLSYISVIARLVTRWRVLKQLGWDDAAIVVALVCLAPNGPIRLTRI
jgi:hypothetical protein